jgi:hypothetical protein
LIIILVVDFLGVSLGVVVVGRKALVVEAVVELEPNVPVLTDHRASVVRTVKSADEVQPVCHIGGDFGESFGLIAFRFIAADHIEVPWFGIGYLHLVAGTQFGMLVAASSRPGLSGEAVVWMEVHRSWPIL